LAADFRGVMAGFFGEAGLAAWVVARLALGAEARDAAGVAVARAGGALPAGDDGLRADARDAARAVAALGAARAAGALCGAAGAAATFADAGVRFATDVTAFARGMAPPRGLGDLRARTMAGRRYHAAAFGDGAGI
jgi:hypothetical protein